ncbi:MAG: hypothetical protein HY067_10400 [Betaproteobacteria bacterium]|nr:hypothetical protein [Betaproteobacteria bacterium]
MSELIAEAAVEKKLEVIVIYNGVPKSIGIEPDDTIKQLLDHAIQVFAPLPQPHLLSLFTEKGEELNESLTVRQAGIQKRQQLLLRPSQVKGGFHS